MPSYALALFGLCAIVAVACVKTLEASGDASSPSGTPPEMPQMSERPAPQAGHDAAQRPEGRRLEPPQDEPEQAGLADDRPLVSYDDPVIDEAY